MVLHYSLIVIASAVTHPLSQGSEMSVNNARALLNWAVSPSTRGASGHFQGEAHEIRGQSRFGSREIWFKNSCVSYNVDTSKMTFLLMTEQGLPRGKNLSLQQCKQQVFDLIDNLESPYEPHLTSQETNSKTGHWVFKGTMKFGSTFAGKFRAEVNPDTGAITNLNVGNTYAPPAEQTPVLTSSELVFSLATQLRSKFSISEFEVNKPARLELFNPSALAKRVPNALSKYTSLPQRYSSSIQSRRNSYLAAIWITPVGSSMSELSVTIDPWSYDLITVHQSGSNSSRIMQPRLLNLDFKESAQIICGKMTSNVQDPRIDKTLTPKHGKFAHPVVLQSGRGVRLFYYDDKINRLKITSGGKDHFGKPNATLEKQLRSVVSAKR